MTDLFVAITAAFDKSIKEVGIEDLQKARANGGLGLSGPKQGCKSRTSSRILAEISARIPTRILSKCFKHDPKK